MVSAILGQIEGGKTMDNEFNLDSQAIEIKENRDPVYPWTVVIDGAEVIRCASLEVACRVEAALREYLT
jgi:hypothetical protein